MKRNRLYQEIENSKKIFENIENTYFSSCHLQNSTITKTISNDPIRNKTIGQTLGS